MSGIAAGLGALGEGFVRGIRIGSDLADAETRRGLQGMQMKREQAAIDKEQQLTELRTQIANEVSNFKPAGPDDIEGFNGHYERLTPLLMKQAALSGVDPTLVQQSIDERRKGKYAERLYTALGDIQAGNPMGFEKLKPLYKSFKDKGDMIGGAYDQKTDSITLNFVPPGGGDGKPESMTLPREAFVRQALGYLNTRDAVMFDVKDLVEQRQTKQKQDFTAGENQKERDLRVGLTDTQEKGADRRAGISAGATIEAARITQDGRVDAASRSRNDREYEKFQDQINDALGWNKNNPLVTPDQLQKRNTDAAALTNIFNTTREIGGRKLSAYEAAQVNNFLKLPAKEQQRLIKEEKAAISQKDGYMLIDVNGIRAILPGQK